MDNALFFKALDASERLLVYPGEGKHLALFEELLITYDLCC